MVPEPLREWVLDTSRRMDNAPPDFAAAAAIVVAGALLGRKVGVRPKRNDDWTVIPNLWGGLVGLPASMKTPTLNQVLRPVKRLAAEARERHEEVLKEHELDNDGRLGRGGRPQEGSGSYGEEGRVRQRLAR
jgi:putative DNA primase/helicase